MAIFIQTITLTRRVEGDELTKGQALHDLMDRAHAIAIPSEFEVTAIDVWKVKVDKDGNESRDYMED